jgi:hypothetical protein
LGEVLFTAPRHEFKNLQTLLSGHAGSRASNPERVQIAKYFFNKKQWMRITANLDDPKEYPPLDTLPEKARAGELKRRENSRINLRENQCKLQSGDVVVIYEPPTTAGALDIDAYFVPFLSYPGIALKREPRRDVLHDSYERWGFSGSLPSGRNTVEQGVFISVDESEFE